MLKLTQKAGFVKSGSCATFGMVKTYRLITGEKTLEFLGPWTETQFKEISDKQELIPVRIGKSSEKKTYWIFNNLIYWSTEELSPEDVNALLLDKERKKKRAIDRAHSMIDIKSSDEIARQAIPDEVKIFVWQRDKGKCVKCGSNKNLEFDHIIPLSLGGSNTARNIQLLCEDCNREKGGNLV